MGFYQKIIVHLIWRCRAQPLHSHVKFECVRTRWIEVGARARAVPFPEPFRKLSLLNPLPDRFVTAEEVRRISPGINPRTLVRRAREGQVPAPARPLGEEGEGYGASAAGHLCASPKVKSCPPPIERRVEVPSSVVNMQFGNRSARLISFHQ